jgi:hypothetical protein
LLVVVAAEMDIADQIVKCEMVHLDQVVVVIVVVVADFVTPIILDQQVVVIVAGVVDSVEVNTVLIADNIVVVVDSVVKNALDLMMWNFF